MSNPAESLLQDDHRALGGLLHDLEVKLLTQDMERAFVLLDTVWARLAVHIRAENLRLFPKLMSVPATSFTGSGGLPSFAEAQALLSTLRADHDFFMKELAQAIATMREIRTKAALNYEDIDGLHDRLHVIKQRLDTHNRMEEEQVYVWPSLLFDEKTLAELCEGVRHELENLPPRLGKSQE